LTVFFNVPNQQSDSFLLVSGHGHIEDLYKYRPVFKVIHLPKKKIPTSVTATLYIRKAHH
jgi:hypothetical protein